MRTRPMRQAAQRAPVDERLGQHRSSLGRRCGPGAAARWLRVATVCAAAGLPALAAAQVASGSPAFVDTLAERINTYRVQHGIAPLSPAQGLTELAAEHSAEMAASRRLSHRGFQQRLQRAASGLCVENVAHNFATPQQLLEGWRQSPDHHRNLLEPGIGRMGLASRGAYVTFFACH